MAALIVDDWAALIAFASQIKLGSSKITKLFMYTEADNLMTYLVLVGFDVGVAVGCILEYLLLRKLNLIKGEL